MRTTITGIALLAVFCIAPALRAEKANMRPESLRKIATHVITGTVNRIYERKSRDGGYKVTRYVAEVQVKSVEKGEGLPAGGLAYVRYWNRRWVGPGEMPASTNGHRGLPSEGDTIRIYLARNAYDGFTDDNKDGGLNVIGANGFEALPKDPGRGEKR